MPTPKQKAWSLLMSGFVFGNIHLLGAALTHSGSDRWLLWLLGTVITALVWMVRPDERFLSRFTAGVQPEYPTVEQMRAALEWGGKHDQLYGYRPTASRY